jgi:hypothetical protein
MRDVVARRACTISTDTRVMCATSAKEGPM